MIAAVYACQRCGFEFEYERANDRQRRTVCEDCQRAKKCAANRATSASRTARLNAMEVTVLLPSGHPILPVLARYVDVVCAARLALAAVRTGRYDVAEAALRAYA